MKSRITRELARTQALILAGGQGERLQPLTVLRPKPAVAFGGIFRIIDFTLSNCFYSGVSRVSLLTQYKYEELHRYVRKGWSGMWNESESIDRTLLFLPPVSGKRYRGTADSVFQNISLLEADNTEFVLVLSGDHIYQMDYQDLLRQHVETNADLTIATVEHPLKEASHFGVVEADRDLKVTGFAEKPLNPCPLPSRPTMALVSMGVYIFKKAVLLAALRENCEAGQGYDFGRDVIPLLIQSGRTYAYDFRDKVRDCPRYWRDIGSLDSYYEASMDLVRTDSPFDPYVNDVWPSQPTRHPSIGNHARSRLCSNPDGHSTVSQSVLSPGVRIEAGAEVHDCVLMPGVRIGKGARLHRTIVEEGVHIPADFEVGFDLDSDRIQHKVTRSGVVVVSQISNSKPAILEFRPRLASVSSSGALEHKETVHSSV